MTSVVIIQAGTPPEDIRASVEDISHWFIRALGGAVESVDVVPVYLDEPLPRPNPKSVAIITGSWSMVTDRHPWSERLAEWIRDAMVLDVPMFGVCYGHQIMAHALGGTVDYHMDGCEIGCRKIYLSPTAVEDPLLKSWPTAFSAHLTHLQTIVELPPGAKALAFSDHDPHQIVRYGAKALSTQFHPEFTPEIAAACIRRRAAVLEQEEDVLSALLASLDETPEALRLLKDFVEIHSQQA